MKYLIVLVLAMFVMGCNKKIQEARAPISSPAASAQLDLIQH